LFVFGKGVSRARISKIRAFSIDVVKDPDVAALFASNPISRPLNGEFLFDVRATVAKWVCDPHRITNQDEYQVPVRTVISVGSNGSASSASAVLEVFE